MKQIRDAVKAAERHLQIEKEENDHVEVVLGFGRPIIPKRD